MPLARSIITSTTLTVLKYLVYITAIEATKTLQLSLHDLGKTYKRLRNVLQPSNALIRPPLPPKLSISLKLISPPNLAANSRSTATLSLNISLYLVYILSFILRTSRRFFSLSSTLLIYLEVKYALFSKTRTMLSVRISLLSRKP